MNGIRILAVLAVALAGGHAAAQQKSLRDQIVGTWDFGVAEVIAPDGKKSFPFGETPKGVLIFTADGHFAQIHVASDVPKIASGNRLTGTPAGRGAGTQHRQAHRRRIRQHQPQCRRRAGQCVELLNAGEIGAAGSHLALDKLASGVVLRRGSGLNSLQAHA
jgi:hypothetical protein